MTMTDFLRQQLDQAYEDALASPLVVDPFGKETWKEQCEHRSLSDSVDNLCKRVLSSYVPYYDANGNNIFSENYVPRGEVHK